MRKFGFQVPESVAKTVPRVVAVGLRPETEDRTVRAQLRALRLEHHDALFDAVMVVASGEYEVLVIGLDAFEPHLVWQLLEALRRRSATRGVAVVGLSAHTARRQELVQRGGDVAIASLNELRPTVRWLTGARVEPPGDALDVA
jgi:hypothetical protein